MLPAFRVIGHKEYGNRPPGGTPGRKSDPTYSMDWRRNRVANFTPRTEQEDDMPSAQEVADALLDTPIEVAEAKALGLHNTTTLRTLLSWSDYNDRVTTPGSVTKELREVKELLAKLVTPDPR